MSTARFKNSNPRFKSIGDPNNLMDRMHFQHPPVSTLGDKLDVNEDAGIFFDFKAHKINRKSLKIDAEKMKFDQERGLMVYSTHVNSKYSYVGDDDDDWD